MPKIRILHHLILFLGTFLTVLATTPGTGDGWKTLIAATPAAISETFMYLYAKGRP